MTPYDRINQGFRMFPPSAPTQLQMPQAPQQQPMMPNFFNRVGSALTSNPMALSMAGLGILSGRGNSDAFSRGMQGFMAGRAFDQSDKEAERKRKDTNLTARFLIRNGLATDEETARALVRSGEWKGLIKEKKGPVTVAKGAKLVDPVTGREVYSNAEGVDSEDAFEREQKIRKEYIGAQTVKEFQEVESAFRRVRASVEQPTAAGDLALIFNYMKMLDPGSVVRESEFATAAATGSYGERIKGFVQKILSGQRLSEEQRADFTNRAERLYGAQRDKFGVVNNQYRGVSEAYGVDPNRVLYNPPEFPPITLKSGGQMKQREDGSFDWMPGGQ